MKFNHPFLYACTVIIAIVTGQLLININIALETKICLIAYGTLWTILASSVSTVLEARDLNVA